MTRIIRTALFPGATRDSGAVFEGFDLGGLKAAQTRMLLVIEHTSQAQVVVVKGLGQGRRIDCAFNDKHGAPRSLGIC